MNQALFQVSLARTIAVTAHAGQTRRDGHTPYMTHVEAVVSRVAGQGWRAEAAAWLHDTVEDTGETLASLTAAGVDLEVVELVDRLTRRAGETYHDFLVRIKANPVAVKVKVADILSNLADSPTDKQIVRYAMALLYLKDATA